MTINKNVFKVLTAVLLAASFVMTGSPLGGRFEGTAIAKSKPQEKKLAADLEDAIGYAPDRLVRVIIETAPSQKGAAFSNVMGRIADLGGMVFRSLNGGKTAAVQIPARVLYDLADDSGIKYISLDRDTQVTGHLEATTGASLVRNYGTSSTGAIDGHGIGIAVLDSGVYSAHHSFNTGRVVASVDFTGEGRTDDPYGHGTHVASIAAGNNHIANGMYTGVAPAAKIINVRVLNSLGAGSMSNAIAGIDWCIANKAAYNIRVLNLSFGTVAVDSYANDPLCQAVRRAFNAGMVVCVAAGNTGKDLNGTKIFGAVHSPGIEPSAITVGAANTLGTNSRADDSVATYSSRGPTRGYTTDTQGAKHYDNLIKPDLIAPGNKIIDGQSPNNRILTITPTLDANVSTNAVHKMMYMSGTSMATPAVAGAAALLIQRNPNLTPNLVKAILQYTAKPLAGFSNFEQGAGELNVEGGVRLAGLIRTDLAGRAKGDPLLTGAAPTQTTTIAGNTFSWGGGFLQKWNFVYGNNLILKYQGIYGSGVLLGNGVLLSNGVLLMDSVLLSDGVQLSQGVLLSNGVLLGEGILLSAGILLSDGLLLADGVLLGNGILLSDNYFAQSMGATAQSTLALAAVGGDLTDAMLPEPDPDPLN